MCVMLLLNQSRQSGLAPHLQKIGIGGGWYVVLLKGEGTKRLSFCIVMGEGKTV